ncbi:hypothetical protein M3M35_00170 [Fructilactobacillus myrtifloralis]|uniref:Uncharacterized protein n=1 Tax=Fructilactobacillus myrtifloralis TaxID=2940301 RepID=A0ABY5BPM0_9LACO|nr:hypothetical protein [Fructilactobacillus myrtifloralis]USS85126.1 hypothetical protein M3M35_00170 [Fructilactobacillus myrtifloralis]
MFIYQKVDPYEISGFQSELISNEYNLVKKLKIEAKDKDKILEELNEEGINKETVFPE